MAELKQIKEATPKKAVAEKLPSPQIKRTSVDKSASDKD
jgi:hypothetical protein